MPAQSDHDYVRRLMRDFNHQKQSIGIVTVKLPCGNRVQIQGAEDQYIKCPSHGEQYLYTHSAVAGRQRLYGK